MFITYKWAIYTMDMLNSRRVNGIYPIPCAPWCWNIYLHDWAIFGVNVGKYSSTMEHLGIPVTYCVARVTKTRCRLTPGKNRKDQLERSSRPIVSCPSPTHLWFFGKPRNKSTSWELLGFLCSYETLGQNMGLSKTKRLIELCIKLEITGHFYARYYSEK